MKRLKALRLMLLNLFVILSINMHASIEITDTNNATNGECNGSIEILVDGDSGPFSLVLNGGTPIENIFGNYTFESLCEGSYEIAVINMFKCSIVLSTNISDCGNGILNTSFISPYSPSDCSSSNGSFQVIQQSAQGGVQPYVYEFQDESGNILTATNNLSLGTYYHIATDAQGCKGVLEFNLAPSSGPVMESELIDGSCSNQSTGAIIILVSNENGYAYNFNWSNGLQHSNTLLSELEDLSAGTYTVTITSNSSTCEVVRQYVVPELTPTIPLTLNPVVIHSCPNQSNGSMETNVIGGIQPYSFNWSDGGFSLSPFRLNLSSGNYAVTVTDFCGDSESYTFSIAPLGFPTFSIVTDCGNEGAIGLAGISGGNPPYSYSWNTGVTTTGISGLSSGDYTITITDSEGCIRIGNATLQNAGYEIVDQTEPCNGISNGTITIDIDNPSWDPINVLVNGIFRPVDNDGILFLDELGAGQPYIIDISIGDCDFQEVITLEGVPTEKIYQGYEDFECVYQEACNGESIEGAFSYELAYYDYTDPPGAWLKECYVPVRCRNSNGQDLEVDKYSFNKVNVKAYAYRAILINALSQGNFSYDFVTARLAAFDAKNASPCALVRYCPANLEWITILDPVFNGNYDPPQFYGDGCVHINCGFPTADVDFCIDDVTPWYPNSNSGSSPWSASCDVRIYNAYQIIQWEQDLKDAFPGFTETELYKDFIEVYRNNPKTVCADVTFCKTDFTLLYENVDEQTCPQVLRPDCNTFAPVGTEWELGPSCDILYCLNFPPLRICEGSTQGYAAPQPLLPFNELEFFTSPETSAALTIQQGNGCTELINFGKTFDEGNVTPKGLLSSGNGYKFNDFTPRSKEFTTVDMPHVELFIDDIASDQIVYVQELSSNTHTLNYVSNSSSWVQKLQSDNMDISFLTQKSDGIYVGGTFNGNILLDNVNKGSSSNNTSGFLYKFSFDGVTTNLTTLDHIMPNEKLVFSETNNEIFISGKSATNFLHIGEETQSRDLSSSLGVFKIGVDANGIINLVTNITYGDKVKLVDQIQGEGNLPSIRILKGSGAVMEGGREIISEVPLNNERLMIISSSANGDINFAKPLTEYSISNDKVDAVTDENGNLYLGITVNNTQGDDILLVKMDSNGNEAGYLLYATEDDENVSQLMYDNGILYFGGEFSGNNRTRFIGKRSFINFSECNQTAYISYVPVDEFSNINSQVVQNYSAIEKSTMEEKIKLNNISKTEIDIYPNPFTKKLFITIKSKVSQDYQLEIYDGLGKKIFEQQQYVPIGTKRIEINELKDTPSGIYFVKIWSEDGNVNSTKQVVKE